MTCCADDIQYGGIIAETKGKCTQLNTGDWLYVTAVVSVEKHKAYRGVGPVLKVTEYTMTSPPENQVVSF